MIEQIYKYDHASELRPTLQGQALALASDQNVPTTPVFLKARALYPNITAKSLRAVSEIVGSRFYVPPSMLAKILREADPVATVGADAVRFEGFSACCSAYIRLDLDNSALEAQARSKGTTNVDFGPELRGALSSVARDTEMEISIGSNSVEVVTDGKAYFEKKVPLPLRWVKGFAEVQVAMAGMCPAFSLPKIAAQRFLRGLPRGKNDQRIWVGANGPMARVTAREAPGAVPLRGCHRLRVFEPLAALADSLDVQFNPATGATSWALNFGTQRVWLVLNAEPWRGFSGDGGLLSRMANSDDTGLAAVTAQLSWQDSIDAEAISKTTDLSIEVVDVALAKLAAGGRLGFDLAQRAYFHRNLPFDMSKTEGLNPRLKSAKKLVDAGAVRWSDDVADVSSDDVIHKVELVENDWRCTCPWFAKNGNQRGPCKHILAAEMEMNRQND
ncbi:MAG: SWIM zinc finger family protein [Pelagimonas sp.]|uniref:SWIM zinc finger family protein n=1 Tax=Pelagimonas sp. TaxID=2073170 RepID=UPI003D6BC95F